MALRHWLRPPAPRSASSPALPTWSCGRSAACGSEEKGRRILVLGRGVEAVWVFLPHTDRQTHIYTLVQTQLHTDTHTYTLVQTQLYTSHTHIRIYMHTYTHIYTETHTLKHTYTHLFRHAYTYITHTYPETHVLIHTYTRTETCTYTHTHTHLYTHIETHLHRHTHMHTCTHTSIYTHTHRHRQVCPSRGSPEPPRLLCCWPQCGLSTVGCLSGGSSVSPDRPESALQRAALWSRCVA